MAIQVRALVGGDPNLVPSFSFIRTDEVDG